MLQAANPFNPLLPKAHNTSEQASSSKRSGLVASVKFYHFLYKLSCQLQLVWAFLFFAPPALMG